MPERAVDRAAGGVHDRVVVLPQHVERHPAVPDVHAAEELDLGRVERLLQHPDDGLHLHVVGRHAVADEAVRRRQPVQHVDADRLARGEQRGGGVQPGRARSDDRDPGLSLLHVVHLLWWWRCVRSGGGSERWESGRAPLDEGRHPLSQVGRPDEAVDMLVGGLQCLVERGVLRVEHLARDHRHGAWAAVEREVARVRLGGAEHLVARDDAADQPQLPRLGGVERAGRQQQVERALLPDEAGERPRDAVLGDEPAAGERGGEPRGVGGEPDMAEQRLHEPDARTRSVDRGDQRLREPAFHVDRLVGQPGALLPECAEAGEVGTRAERAARAGDHDGADPLVGRGLGQPGEVGLLQILGPAVAPLGTVEGEGEDAVAVAVGEHGVSSDVGARFRIGHTLTLVAHTRPSGPVSSRRARCARRMCAGSRPEPRRRPCGSGGAAALRCRSRSARRSRRCRGRCPPAAAGRAAPAAA